MSLHLERSLNNLTKELIFLSSIAEESVKLSIKSLYQRDTDIALKVIENDKKIDAKEIDIEEECLKIIALHQPVAIDLRRLIVILKINNDLERIGDLSKNISRHVIKIIEKKEKTLNIDIEKISNKVLFMLKLSINSLVKTDDKFAKIVLDTDDEVDEMNRDITISLIQSLKNDPDNTELYIQHIHIIRHLERIADHATNIAEDIIYLINGEIVRHPHLR